MDKNRLKEEIQEVAEYLDCNGPELWSELEEVIDEYVEHEVENALWHNNVGSN